MSEPTKLIAARDIKEIAKLAVLAVISWFIPDNHWGRISGGIAALVSRFRPARTRSRVECIRVGLGPRRIATPVRDVEARCRAGEYEERLQLLREYRPGGWRPVIRLTGREHIEAALARGHGAVLWISQFAFSSLVAKMALHQAGFSVSHLSRAEHGPSATRFGMRFLNPIVTHIENRYLGERVVIGPEGAGRAMKELSQRLRFNGIVSISAMVDPQARTQARKSIQVPFLHGSISLSTGPATFALKAGAPLLPVFAIRTAAGEFEVDIGRPLDVERQPDGKSPHVAALQQYAETLEAYVLRFPHLWPNWGYLEVDSGDQKSGIQ